MNINWELCLADASEDEYKYVVENDDVHLAKDKIAKIIKEHQK